MALRMPCPCHCGSVAVFSITRIGPFFGQWRSRWAVSSTGISSTGAVNEVDGNERQFFLEASMFRRFLVEERKGERFESDGG